MPWSAINEVVGELGGGWGEGGQEWVGSRKEGGVMRREEEGGWVRERWGRREREGGWVGG